jgi:hypothetical protein
VIDTSTPPEPTVPRSKAPAQKVPESTDNEIWGALPPEVLTVAVMSQPPVAVPGMPIPRPTSVAGAVLFRVTVTVPAADAVNVRIAEPWGAIIALSDCVPGPGAGVVGAVGVVELLLLHAAQSSTTKSASSGGRVMRLVKNPLL